MIARLSGERNPRLNALFAAELTVVTGTGMMSRGWGLIYAASARVNMKIDVNERRIIILKEIYCDTVLETEEGNQLSVVMRDDTIEMCVPGKEHYRVDMKTGEIRKLETF